MTDLAATLDTTSQTERPSRPRLAQAVSVLMPVCNEVDVIDTVLEEWVRDVFDHLPEGSELVFDDCSTDGTTQRIEAWRERYPFIRVNRSQRDGFFNSAMRLYRLAECDLVFFTDSDGQYVAEDFWRVAAQIEHNDMVHGAKVERHDPRYRLTFSGVYNVIVREMFASVAVDANSAFRLVRRELLDDVLPQIRHLRMLPNSEMYIRAERLGYRIQNVPVRHRPRPHGESRSLPAGRFFVECWHAFRGLRALRDELAAHDRWSTPIR